MSGCQMLCSNLVPPLPTQNRPSRLIYVAKRLFSANFGHFWAPLGDIWDILGQENGPNWSVWMSSVLFQSRSNLFHGNIGHGGLFSLFCLFRPILASFRHFLSPWAHFLTLLTWTKGPTWSVWMPPVVFQPCSTPSNPK